MAQANVLIELDATKGIALWRARTMLRRYVLCRRLPHITLFVLLSLPTPTASATLFRFEWSFLDGDPLIKGFIDTALDALYVTSYVDTVTGPGSHIDALIPDLTNGSVFPNRAWRFPSYRANGSIFDIPDNWDMTIDGTWAFISDLDILSIPYLNRPIDYQTLWTAFPGFWGFKLFVPPTAIVPPSLGGNSVGGTYPAPPGIGVMFSGLPTKTFWSQASGHVQIEIVPEPSPLFSLLVSVIAMQLRKSSGRL